VLQLRLRLLHLMQLVIQVAASHSECLSLHFQLLLHLVIVDLLTLDPRISFNFFLTGNWVSPLHSQHQHLKPLHNLSVHRVRIPIQIYLVKLVFQAGYLPFELFIQLYCLLQGKFQLRDIVFTIWLLQHQAYFLKNYFEILALCDCCSILGIFFNWLTNLLDGFFETLLCLR